jgi:general stress protein 26
LLDVDQGSPAAAPGWEREEGVDLADAALDDHGHRRRLHPAGRNVTFGERGMTMHEPVTELDDRFSDPGAKATPWAKAREVLETAQLSWVTTVRADGRPHVTPLVSVWLDDAVHFTTGPGEQKAVNLVRNPHVVMTTGCNRWDQGLDVMVEGEAQRVTDRATLERLAAAWATKWNGQWRFEVADGGFAHGDADGPVLVFAVRPVKVLAFGKGEFSHTRYRPS